MHVDGLQGAALQLEFIEALIPTRLATAEKGTKLPMTGMDLH